MQTKKPPNAIDVEMGKRLQNLRGGLSQQALADAIGINKQRYSSYEYGRVALRFEVALRICKYLDVSQLWLGTGQGRMRGYIPLNMECFEKTINDRTKFYDGFIRVRALLEAASQKNDIAKAKQSIPEESLSNFPLHDGLIRKPFDTYSNPTSFKITVNATDQDIGIVSIVLPPWASGGQFVTSLQLRHPGYIRIKKILRNYTSEQPDVLDYEMLLACLPPHQANEDFLRKLNPYCVMELESVARKIVRLEPLENEIAQENQDITTADSAVSTVPVLAEEIKNMVTGTLSSAQRDDSKIPG